MQGSKSSAARWRAACAGLLAGAALLTAGAAHATGNERVLWSFSGGADGGLPNWSSPIPGPGGVFYGTTLLGGASNVGVVYQLTPPAGGVGPWTEIVLHSFSCGISDGCYPYGTLLLDGSGALYGITDSGGAANVGAVYKLTPPAGGSGPWTESIVYAFAGGADGATPYGRLVRDNAGNLYGTTYQGGIAGNQGGAAGNGTVYKLTPSGGGAGAWAHQVLYAFQGSGSGLQDGSGPTTGVALGKGGVIYGTTGAGGVLGISAGCPWQVGCGTAFVLTPSKGGTVWTESIMHAFGQSPEDGATPYSSPIVSASGAVFGVTGFGGADNRGYINRGVIYELTPTAGGAGPWTYTVLKTMTQSPDYLEAPLGDLVTDSSGALYGAALTGGPVGVDGLVTNGGGIFKIAPPAGGVGAWTYTALHTFSADSGDFCRSGCYPYSGVSVSKSGIVTGTTTGGGSHPPGTGQVGPGVVFQIKQ